jgi:hypothetical protein
LIGSLAALAMPLGVARPAGADTTGPIDGTRAAVADAAPAGDHDRGDLDADELALLRQLSAPGGGYARVLFTLAGGRGLRLNNPFRLRTQLGESAESLSLTAPYFDLGIAAAFGDPFGLQHGAMAHLSIATTGVGQQAVSLSYLVGGRGSSAWLGYGRIGLAALVAPDPNPGGEAALGVGCFLPGALGAHAELVGDLFYGAGTYETRYTVVPVISLQAGLTVDLEVLP